MGLGKGDRKCRLGEPSSQQASPSQSCCSGEKARQQWWELKVGLAAIPSVLMRSYPHLQAYLGGSPQVERVPGKVAAS